MPETLSALFGFAPHWDADQPKPFYLVARPGFFGSFGSWLDIFSPVAWNFARLPDGTDFDAEILALDGRILGADMKRAIEVGAPKSIAA
jgi:hypothetical protein